MDASDALFGVYQDWVHQNPGTHLYGGIREDGKWQAIWKKLVCLPTQRYNVTSGQVRKRFVSTLTAEPNGRRGRKWNAERVIVFQTFILQRVRPVTGAKNIRA